MKLRELVVLVALGIALNCLFSTASAQDSKNQGVHQNEGKKQDQKQDQAKDQKQDRIKDQKKDEKKDQNQGAGTASGGDQGKAAQNSPNSSRLQMLYPPADIVIQDGDCESRITALAVRSTAKDVKLQGPMIVGGALQDKDSPKPMPAQMFQLLQKTGSAVCGKYTEITADAPAQIPDDLSQSPLYIGVREEWTNAGGYSGNLWIGAKGDSAAQSVALKVTPIPAQTGDGSEQVCRILT